MSETKNQILPPPEDEPARNPGARTFHQFIQMLEGGRLDGDISDALREISAELQNYVLGYGGKPKASLTIKIDFTLEKGVFDIVADFTTRLPKVKRDRSIAWATAGNEFTPENPRQGSLFGKPRDVTSGDAAEVRSV